jgi:hypothetical protein|tara:strand:+ start:205 stop:699 length:495 start_codon:yes stop_codon:yes gene_type:complete
MKSKKGQQEMVGFVLIVVLVVVGLMVFLIISLRDTPENEGSLEVVDALDALMKHTTECAVVYVPAYDDFEALFKSCHDGDQCSNLDRSACDYLNESLTDVVGAMVASEGGAVSYYQVDFIVKDDVGEEGLLRIFEGNCTGGVNAAQRSFVSGSESLVIRMKTCA